jgi:hypothetical protein
MADIQEGNVERIKILRDDFDLSYKLQNDPNWWKSYRFKSPIFDFTIPKNNILDIDTTQDITYGKGVSDGYWIMIESETKRDFNIEWEVEGKYIDNNQRIPFITRISYTFIVF